MAFCGMCQGRGRSLRVCACITYTRQGVYARVDVDVCVTVHVRMYGPECVTDCGSPWIFHSGLLESLCRFGSWGSNKARPLPKCPFYILLPIGSLES